MSLNQDVIGVIIDFIGHKASLLNKTNRDRYFKKYGVWIHIYHLNFGFLPKVFPEKFRKYRLNLDIDKFYNHYGNYRTGLKKLLKYLDLENVDFPEDNFLFLSCLNTIANLKHFQLPLGYCGIENLEKITPDGWKFWLTPRSGDYDRAKIADDLGRKIRLLQNKNCRFYTDDYIKEMQTDIDLISDKLYRSTIEYLDPQKKYPKLEVIIYEGRGNITDFCPENFPKLRYIFTYSYKDANLLEKFNKPILGGIFYSKNRMEELMIGKKITCLLQPVYTYFIAEERDIQKQIDFSNRHLIYLSEFYKQNGKNEIIYVYRHVPGLNKTLLIEVMQKFKLRIVLFGISEELLVDLFSILTELNLTETKIVLAIDAESFKDYHKLVELYEKNNIFIRVKRNEITVSCPEYLEIWRYLEPLWQKSKI